MEAYEVDYDLKGEAADLEETEGQYQEEPEADPDESQEEEAGEDQSEEETGSDESEEELEEEAAEEDPEEDPETVSGNDFVISGDVIVFPEGYVLSDLEGDQLDVEQIVQAIEKQNENITAGFACVNFFLGLLVGAIMITGFRLRRV